MRPRTIEEMEAAIAETDRALKEAKTTHELVAAVRAGESMRKLLRRRLKTANRQKSDLHKPSFEVYIRAEEA